MHGKLNRIIFVFVLLLTLNHIRTIAPPGGNYILYTLHLNMIGVNCLQTLEWRPNFNWTKDKLLIQSVVKHSLDKVYIFTDLKLISDLIRKVPMRSELKIKFWSDTEKFIPTDLKLWSYQEGKLEQIKNKFLIRSGIQI